MSSIFTREKRDGSYRMPLNLKQLNNHIVYEYFKVESLQSVLNIIRPNCQMASVDMKDAFYTMPIHQSIKFIRVDIMRYEGVQTTILYFEKSWLSACNIL